jgi:hypothetical protein
MPIIPEFRRQSQILDHTVTPEIDLFTKERKKKKKPVSSYGVAQP